MAVTPTEFKARYTEFASTSDARCQVYLDDAAGEMNEGRWGDLYDRGQAALAAHLLSVADQNAASGGSGAALGGQVASRTVGSVSVSFSNGVVSGGSAENFFLSTSYGAEYWRLSLKVGMGIEAVYDE